MMEGISSLNTNISSFLILFLTDSKILPVAAISILIVFYVQYVWRKRKLYLHTMNVPGPLSLPLIGSALYFSGNPYGEQCFIKLFSNLIFSCEFSDILKNITKLFNTYPKICKFWLGPKLFFAVSDADFMEKLLPNCLKKAILYRHTEILMGHGLFSMPGKFIVVVKKLK